MKSIENCYQLLGCNPEDSDIVFEEKYDSICRKYEHDQDMLYELKKAYMEIREIRKDYVQPGDVKGEERCLNNIYYALHEMQQKLKSGYQKKDCVLLMNDIKKNIVFMEKFWMNATLKQLKNSGFEEYCEEAYSDFICKFYEENLEKRILGSQEDKVFGWLKNYSEEKGDFIHYARNSMSHIRSDLKRELMKISTVGLDNIKRKQIAGAYAKISAEEAKITKKAVNNRRKNLEKYNIHEIMMILAKGPNIIKIGEAVNAASQANEYAKYYMVNIVMTFLKVIGTDEMTSKVVDNVLESQMIEVEKPANTYDIYDSMSQELTNYIMVKDCFDFDDVIDTELCNYSDIGIQQEGPIRFFKHGIKYIDEILVNYYAVVKGDNDKKSKSIKVIRTRHWNKFKELVLKD